MFSKYWQHLQHFGSAKISVENCENYDFLSRLLKFSQI